MSVNSNLVLVGYLYPQIANLARKRVSGKRLVEQFAIESADIVRIHRLHQNQYVEIVANIPLWIRALTDDEEFIESAMDWYKREL